MEDELNINREKLLSFFTKYKNYLEYVILAVILFLGVLIRSRNFNLLKDITTGKYIPLDLDSLIFLRYVKEIVETGTLPLIDTMRYVPLGLETINTGPLLPYTIAYLYKFLSFFNSNISVELVDIIYPVIFFVFGAIFFYLLVRNLFDKYVALLATAFLVVIPAYLFRTMTGLSDKESLAFFYFFAGLYFFVKSIKEKEIKKSIIFASISGILTSLMNLVWGGGQFLIYIIVLFSFEELFFNRFTRKDYLSFSSWFFFYIAFILIGFKDLFYFIYLLLDPGVVIAIAIIATGIISFLIRKNNLLTTKISLNNNIPVSLSLLIIFFLIGFASALIIKGWSYILAKLNFILSLFLNPIGSSRLTLTVAENMSPFFRPDWLSSFGWVFFLMFMFGSILLFFKALSSIKFKFRLLLTIIYSIFIFSFIFSNYSRGNILNGQSLLSQIFVFVPLFTFLVVLMAAYFYKLYRSYKTKEQITNIQVNSSYILALIWFIAMLAIAKSAIRFFMALTPIAAVFASYFIVNIFYIIKKNPNKFVKYSALVLMILLIFSPIPNYNGIIFKFANESWRIGKYTGPSYNLQWQQSMAWVRENTPKDSVFAHWWDYGYYVQFGGERSTILDGGNFIAYWDHLLGRYVLTGQSDIQALEFLKTHKANYLLIDPTDIGKYPAYSRIGSDENFDRFSWLNVFSLDKSRIQETRNGFNALYLGQSPLDEDIKYKDTLLKREQAVIIGLILNIIQNENNQISLGTPTAIVVYQNKRFDIPVSCVYMNEYINFQVEEGINGCIRIIPNIVNSQITNNIMDTAAIYVSEKTRKSLMARLYLFNENPSYFNLVYSDENQLPLALFEGRLIGPIRIWEINYPSDIKENQEYLRTDYPQVQLI